MTIHYQPPAPKTGTSLHASVPIALFPVRLETRFVDDALKVRFYPDVVHRRNPMSPLTPAETVLGEAYWDSNPDGVDGAGQPIAKTEEDRQELLAIHAGHWAQLTQRYGSARALWIADQTSKPARVGFAAGVPLLPSRWRLVGYRQTAGDGQTAGWHEPALNKLADHDVDVAPHTLDERMFSGLAAFDSPITQPSSGVSAKAAKLGSNPALKSTQATAPNRFDPVTATSYIDVGDADWLHDYDRAVQVLSLIHI